MEEIIILIISVIAGMATYIASNILKRGAVIASAIITLVSGIILPYFSPVIGSASVTAAAIEGITDSELIPTKDDVYVIPAKSFGRKTAAITPTRPLAITAPCPIS